jgi:tetratricopeptide (TPR) repeat protein
MSLRAFVLAGLVLSMVAGDGRAIMREEDAVPEPLSDPAFATGKAAFDRKDWPAVIVNLEDFVARGQVDDDAHNMLGFAYRKLGDYDAAFAHYHQALRLNPRHRGALEYLGEGYLETGQLDRAAATLQQLAQVCRLSIATFAAEATRSGCEEYDDLVAAYRQRGLEPPPD